MNTQPPGIFQPADPEDPLARRRLKSGAPLSKVHALSGKGQHAMVPADAKTRHRAKMAKRKEVQDREVASKTVEKGLLVVHTGPGKGKSTAAFGLMLRALGRWPRRRHPVHQGRLGDRRAAALSRFADQVEWHTMGKASPGRRRIAERDIAAATKAWEKAKELMAQPDRAFWSSTN